MSVSLSDILTTAKNIVTGINQIATNYMNVQGVTNAAALSGPTVVKTSAGRVARISVTTAGSAAGTVYDGGSLQAMSKPIYVIPNTVGVTEVNLPTNFGILVVPGTGQVVTVSYS